jgi:hypothetical protein
MTKTGKPRKKTKSTSAKRKIGYAGQDRKTYVHEPTEITLPDADRFADIAETLELEDDGLRALVIVLRHVKEDLDAMASVERSTEERKDLIQRLTLLESSLARVRQECERHAAVMDVILPEDSRAYLGQALNFSTMNALLQTNVLPAHAERLMQGSVDLLAIEDALRPSREALGLKHGGTLFLGLIRKLHEPIKLWVENHARLNTNSGHRRVARNHLLYWLIYEAADILGPDGLYTPGCLARLCKVMVAECRLDEQGLDSAIKRMKDLVQREKAKRQLAHAEPVTTSLN